jgi:C4-dicarboxylate-specific signal transduction histidine kinase/ligand-binding sensor domain-containing protein
VFVAALGWGPYARAEDVSASESLDPTRAIHHYGQESWTIQDGLPSNTVRDITQTADGYLWLATHAGLVRFDGERFKTFNTAGSPGMGTDFLTHLLAASDGTLWIGSPGGLVRLREGSFTTFTRADGLAAEVIEGLTEDSRGVVWIAAGGEVHRFESDLLTRVERPAEVAGSWIRSIVEGDGGSLWFGTQRHGLLEWRGGEWRSIESNDGRPQNTLYFMHRDRSEALWLAGSSLEPRKLVRFREGRFEDMGLEGLIRGRVRAMHESRDGTLWLACAGGLLRYREERFELWTPDTESTDNRFLAVFEDREGSLWVGSYGAGLQRFTDGAVTAYAERDGLPGRTMALIEDRDRSVWIGGQTGLYRHENGRFVAVTSVRSQVFAIAVDRDGALWLGTEDALLRYSEGELERTPVDRTVSVLFLDSRGRLLVGQPGAHLQILEDGVLRPVEGLEGKSVRWIDEDASGALWLGTLRSGLARLEAGRVDWLTSADGLSSDSLLAHRRDPAGALWIGTEGGGLNRLYGGAFASYRRTDGLHDDSVWPILDSGDGYLWFGGDRGIWRVARQNLADLDAGIVARLAVEVLGPADGLRNVEGSGIGEPSGLQASDGRLWFTTVRGVAVVDPDRLREPASPPPAILEEVLVDGRRHPIGTGLELAPRDEELELHFTAVDLRDADQLELQYSLEGYDDGWRAAGPTRTARYANLPPGEYRFRARAGRAGVWSESAAELELRVLPDWWQTWWVRALVTVAVVGLLSLAYQTRMRAVARRNRELERQVAERDAARTALETTETTTRGILDSLSAHVCVLDNRGAIMRVNESWRCFGRANGASPELVEGVGLDYLEACRQAATNGGDHARRALAGLGEVTAGTTGLFDLEYPCHGPRDQRWYLMRAVPLGTGEGGVVISHIDITERRLAEEELQTSSRKERQQRAQLAHVQRSSAMGELVGALSHEINQPLTAIRSNARAALRFLEGSEPDLDEIREILEDISDDDRRAAEIVRRLRGMLKKEPTAPEPLSINDLVGESLELLHSESLLKKITVGRELDEAVTPVSADRIQLQQVLVNLIVNGFEALEEVPETRRLLTVRTTAEPDTVRVSIEDTGPGLGGADAERLFQAFETSKATGLGMGLSISRSIVEAHGGRLWAENNPDQGATFHFILPRSGAQE